MNELFHPIDPYLLPHRHKPQIQYDLASSFVLIWDFLYRLTISTQTRWPTLQYCRIYERNVNLWLDLDSFYRGVWKFKPFYIQPFLSTSRYFDQYQIKLAQNRTKTSEKRRFTFYFRILRTEWTNTKRKCLIVTVKITAYVRMHKISHVHCSFVIWANFLFTQPSKKWEKPSILCVEVQ